MDQFQTSQPLEGLHACNEPRAWIVTMKGPYVPMEVVGENEVPQEGEVEWNDEDLGKIMINNKAIDMLQRALNPTEFHRVFSHKSQEVVRKVLRSLPKNWKAKKTEMDIQVDGGVEVVEKKKNVAFRASNQKEESEDDATNDESSNEEDITKLVSN
ncbi:hypothetical protein SLEP1_g13243 [Rubroshorea leprosula]|uniref:Uncharacterized protein n=1 Tax=Rubroshorea leprosula TaxID=152421 RepID=A0AAV5IKW4_9ROSI|nr:hypothetical protein SLEP1_g13243 [Rubroshorea leprosula]